MTPTIGIGFLSLSCILFVAYILFLIEQHKLQDELARHCKEEEDERWHPKDTLNPLIEVWVCPQCGFMSTIQSFCIHCASPRPQGTSYLKVALKDYAEQPGHTFPAGFHAETHALKLVSREAERNSVRTR
jgi:hypothetical protein